MLSRPTSSPNRSAAAVRYTSHRMKLLNTSAVSSINLGWRLIFASCVTRRTRVFPTDVFDPSIHFFFFFLALLLSFWTSRGHRCRRFLPPRFLPSIFIAHRDQQSHCSSTHPPVSRAGVRQVQVVRCAVCGVRCTELSPKVQVSSLLMQTVRQC